MADSSLYSSFYTYTYDSLSCYAPMKTVHVVFAYIVCISGFMCFVTRAVPSIRWMHKWWGRTYILFMFWATVASLLIFNHGLPSATIISFIFVTVGLTLGWILISIHQVLFYNHTLERAQELIKDGHILKEASLKEVMEQAKVEVNLKKTFWQRFISLKTAHGTLMFISWLNVAGRIFVTNPAEPFYCYSYPVYKPINTPMYDGANNNGTLTPLPSQPPNVDELPWTKTGLLNWGLMLSLIPLAFALLVAAIAALIDTRRSKKLTVERSSALEQTEPVVA